MNENLEQKLSTIDALHEALNSQTIAGAGVDVLIDIQPDTNHRLIKNENICTQVLV